MIYKLYLAAFSFELLTMVLQIKNCIFLYKIVRNKSDTMDDRLWKDAHSRNMLTLMFIVYWTYLGNIAYKTDVRLTPVAYICAMVFAAITYLYQRFKKELWYFMGQLMVLLTYLPVFIHVIVTPYYVYKTFVQFDVTMDIATSDDRPYYGSPMFKNTRQQFRNEFGLWFSVISLFHSFFGLLAVLFAPVPLFLTEKGNKNIFVYAYICMIYLHFHLLRAKCKEYTKSHIFMHFVCVYR